MNPQSTEEPPARSAAEICRNIVLTRRARALLEDQPKPGVFLRRLVEHGLHAEAVRFMAHALLNREAVWWACLCARHVETKDPAPDQRRALAAAVRWVLEPNDANGREAQEAGQAAGHKTPAGSAALAAFHAIGGTAPGSPPVNPVLAARFAASSVLQSVAKGGPASSSVSMRQFLGLGLDVAYGENRWETKPRGDAADSANSATG